MKYVVCCCSSKRTCMRGTKGHTPLPLPAQAASPPRSRLLSFHLVCVLRLCIYAFECFLFVFSSGNGLLCITVPATATMKSAICFCTATRIRRRQTASKIPIPSNAVDLCSKRNHYLIISRECVPLHYSSFEGHLEVCRLLLQFKADVHVQDMT